MSEPSGVIRLGEESLAAGLFWQPAPSAAAAAREARLVAARTEVGADLYCVRHRGVSQYGLGQGTSGHRPGMRAVAALLAGGIGRLSWIGTFAVNDRWLFVMVRDGTILPDGDLLFASEGDAKERFQAELSAAKWARTYCPSTWNVADALGDDLRGLVGRTADARLRRVAFDPAKPVGIGVLAAVAGIVIWWLVTPRPTTSVPDVPVTPPALPVPWSDQPKPSALIDACAAATARVPMAPGYDIDSVVCTRGGVEATYRRRSGSLAWLSSDFQVRSADRVSRFAHFSDPLSARPAGEQSWKGDDLRRRIWGAAQTFSLDSEITETTAKVLSGHIAAAPDHVRELTVTLGGSLAPGVFATILGPIPALVVEEVRWQPSGWQVKGKAYVR